MQQPRKWPDDLDDVWAKGIDKKTASVSQGESLAAHTWEALSRLRDLARLKPGLPNIVGYDELWNVLFWAVLLHDWGKQASGFQLRLRGRPSRWGSHRHEVLSLVFVDWVASALSNQGKVYLVASIATHHRDISELECLYDITLPPEDDSVDDLMDQLDERLLPAMWKWLKEVVRDWIEQFGFSELGVRYPDQMPHETDAVNLVVMDGRKKIRESLAQLYESGRVSKSIPAQLGIILRGCMMDADHIASAHAGVLPELQITKEAILAAAGRSDRELYEHQVKAGEVIGSTILSSPTGSGKTDAALLWTLVSKVVV